MAKLTTTVDQYAEAEFALRARQSNVNGPALLREIVLQALCQPRPFPHIEPDSARVRPEHLDVRLPLFLADGVRERAVSRGMSASRWMASLIQSHLMQDPVMAGDAIEVLRASNCELRTVGTLLNQIAHALNSHCEETDRLKPGMIDEVMASIKENQAAIRALVRQSQNEWGVK